MNYIFNPFSPTPANLKSHVRGWDMHWADCVGAEIATKSTDLTKAETLYLSHGVNFSGGLNLFGGVTPEVYERLEQLANFTGTLISLDMDMPNYAEQLTKRVGQATCDPRLEALLARLTERFNASTALMQSDLELPHLTIGDSHSTAFAPAKSAVLRTNGQTLYGALRDGFIVRELERYKYGAKAVTLVFGSVDVRHHLMRRDDPGASLMALCKGYAQAAKFVSSEYLVDVEVAAPVPVEYEGRKIPQTGFYGGTPFAGTREERSQLTMNFIQCMEAEGVRVVEPPEHWYTMDPEAYAKTVMELSSSVHIAPTHYRRLGQWPS